MNAKTKYKLKGCKHCSGDLMLEGGQYQCLQCGRPEDKEEPLGKRYRDGKRYPEE